MVQSKLIKHYSHHRLWKIVYKLHVGMKKESIEAASKNMMNRTASQWAELVAHPDTRGQFHDCLLNLEENEGFYLLSALANMTVTREPTESEFIQVCDTVNVLLFWAGCYTHEIEHFFCIFSNHGGS